MILTTCQLCILEPYKAGSYTKVYNQEIFRSLKTVTILGISFYINCAGAGGASHYLPVFWILILISDSLCFPEVSPVKVVFASFAQYALGRSQLEGSWIGERA